MRLTTLRLTLSLLLLNACDDDLVRKSELDSRLDDSTADRSPELDTRSDANDLGPTSDTSAVLDASVGGDTSLDAVADAATPSLSQWPLEILSWDMTRAHPGVHYSWRLGVKGGTYPYQFALLQGPGGMTVHAQRGVLEWDPPTTLSVGNTVKVRITDSAGATVEHTFDIEVTTEGFFFVNGNTAGGDGGPGTLAAPWQTLAHASAAAGDGFVYVRGGTYSSNGLTMKSSNAHRWIAYPGEQVVLDLGGGTIGLNLSQSAVIGFELKNAGPKMFWVGGATKELIWRDNIMHGAGSTGWDNPAFIFFEDGNGRPAEGKVQYDRIVIQDNTFHDLRNPNNHGASVNCFNVKNMLYEDNEAYDIDGPCVLDKDDGYFNTIRNSVLHHCHMGVSLASQWSQAEIEVSHNLIYEVGNGISVGAQPGYIRDIFIHHNTLVDAPIVFGTVTDCQSCTGYVIYRNILTRTGDLLYGTYPVSDGGSYRFPAWVDDPGRGARFEDNLIWTTGPHVAGFAWGLTNLTLSDWQMRGFDVTSLFVDPQLDTNHQLASSSPYRGLYGR